MQAWPSFIALIATLFLVTRVPETTLWLPILLMPEK